MRNNFFPLQILNISSVTEKDLVYYCRNILRKFNLDNSTKLDCQLYLKDENLNSKGLQKIIHSVSLSNSPNTIKVIAINWHDSLRSTGNYNKLLKIFEEPPKNTIIFLTHENKILPKTIVSRGIARHLKEGDLTQDRRFEEDCPNFKEAKKALFSFAHGHTSASIAATQLKKTPSESIKLLEKTIERLMSQKLTAKDYSTILKIMSKVNDNRKLNLNLFDNILIPLKLLISSHKDKIRI